MRSESLNNRVVIQRPGAARNASGEQIGTWVDVATLWADIRHPSGIESTKANAPVSVVKASIRIRYRLGLTHEMRVMHKATVYAIRAILPDEARKQYIDLVCEVVN